VIAVIVAAGEVAGIQPAGADGVGGGLGLVPVAFHHVLAGDDDLAGLTGGDLLAVVIDDVDAGMEEGQAHGAGFDQGVFGVDDQGRSAAFGEAVEVADADPRVGIGIDELEGQGLAVGEDALDPGEVALGETGATP